MTVQVPGEVSLSRDRDSDDRRSRRIVLQGRATSTCARAVPLCMCMYASACKVVNTEILVVTASKGRQVLFSGMTSLILAG